MKPMAIRKGLVIANPWISLILSGQKDWEMRSTATSHRGWFGLIWKGMGAIYGIAQIESVGLPLKTEEMVAAFDHHKIPEEMIRSGEVAKWNTPWILSEVIRLPKPVRYRHPSGAVTWVELDESVSKAITQQVDLLGEIPIIEASQVDNDPYLAPSESRFIGSTVLTQGNIDNNHIYLRTFFERFPSDAVGGSNKIQRAKREITIYWDGGSPITTDLDGSKRFFRARAWIGSFFKINNAKAGEKVTIEEIGAYQYRVKMDR